MHGQSLKILWKQINVQKQTKPITFLHIKVFIVKHLQSSLIPEITSVLHKINYEIIIHLIKALVA